MRCSSPLTSGRPTSPCSGPSPADTIGECFGDLTGHIHALETGLSSDPTMICRCSALDGYTLVSNSDAHSPSKLGREANLLDTGLSYPELARAIQTGEGFHGTIEFSPRRASTTLTATGTVGCASPGGGGGRRRVVSGVRQAADHRRAPPGGAVGGPAGGLCPPGRQALESLAPLPEVIAASEGALPQAEGGRQVRGHAGGPGAGVLHSPGGAAGGHPGRGRALRGGGHPPPAGGAGGAPPGVRRGLWCDRAAQPRRAEDLKGR
ncbi:MAG: hypothetical protein ACLRIS_03020 [Flavonifractor plautii]